MTRSDGAILPMVKKIVVLSDDDKLARAVQIGLQKLGLVIRPGVDGQAAEALDPALIVIALSSPTGEPSVLLARAELGVYLGRVPVLIISDRPFLPEPARRMAHLSFPFSSEVLSQRAAQLLEDAPPCGSDEPLAVGLPERSEHSDAFR